MATIGDRVRTLRESRGMRQEDLAAAVPGLSQDKISKIENGSRQLGGAELVFIARALGVRIDDLLYERAAVARRGNGDTPEAKAALRRFDTFVTNWRTFRDLSRLG